MIIDMDGHLFERREMWRDYIDPVDRELAVSIVDDDLGYPMLHYKGVSPRGAFCWVTTPGVRDADGQLDPDPFLGRPQRQQRDGVPAEHSYDDMPAAYQDALARRDMLDRWGIDEAILFPNWGIEFETMFFDHDLPGHRANLNAWNRFAADVVVDGGGRLHPVGHLTLEGDQDWAIAQLRELRKAGIKLAFFTPGLINGKRMSHPDNDRLWQEFVANDIAIAFHICIGAPRFIPAGWTENDHVTFAALGVSWLDAPVQLALSDLTLNGVFEDHPDLRVCIVELHGAVWSPRWIPGLDATYRMQTKTCGWPVRTLKAPPSKYIRKHCRFGTLPDEDAAGAIQSVGDLFGFGGDWPHLEGVMEPLRDFQAKIRLPATADAEKFWGGNAAWVLGRT